MTPPATSPAPSDIVERLATLIALGELEPDGRLPPERILATRFGISRSRLRQALDQLESEGAVYRRQGRGTFAAPPVHNGYNGLNRLARHASPQEIMEVRLHIEPTLAALATVRASPGDIARLEQLMLATLDQSDQAAYEVADDIFHYHVAKAAGNILFLEVYESIRTVRKLAAWGNLRRESHTAEAMTRFGEQHQSLFRCISSGQSSEAAQAMELHIQDVNRMILAGDP
ncbi:FadR/GntR family transcriptional regulator [Antarcticimicrobium sediminis]|uniref:FadR family transcriptional regulator n=1 Tax=Antarcticimicrobium sediminis TaxID=2546227 RepID=A0A4V2Z7L6_9RHOB|nr:FCD domain-containing protein [Antarcticimicrobium sediminis]TDE36956.1 FadR family transcriptional regulator [Antarcticimicrobium sediminis]